MPVVLANRGIWDDEDGYQIIEILEYQTRMVEDGGSYFYCDVRNVRTGEVFRRTLYTTITTYVEAISACDHEFGRGHGEEIGNDHSDCDRIIADMSAGYPDDRDYSGWYDYDAGLRWSDFVQVDD